MALQAEWQLMRTLVVSLQERWVEQEAQAVVALTGPPGVVLQNSCWDWEEVVLPCGPQRGPCGAGDAGGEQEIRHPSRIQSHLSRVGEPIGNCSKMAYIH